MDGYETWIKQNIGAPFRRHRNSRTPASLYPELSKWLASRLVLVIYVMVEVMPSSR